MDGKILLDWLNETGLGIINGIKDIEKGDFTYIGARGNTVIDYVIKNEIETEKSEKIDIIENIKSDHMKVVFSWEEEIEKTRENKKPTKYISWNDSDITKYKEKIKGIEKETNWTKIKEKIQSALQWKEARKENKYNKERWWDEECDKKKSELIRIIKLVKEGKVNTETRNEKRKEYKWTIKKKKEEFNTNLTKEIEKDKSMKKFWQALNETKKKRTTASKKIKKEEWAVHFRKQYGTNAKEYTEENLRQNKEQSNINEEEIEKIKGEVKEIIDKMKKRKAAGEDKIPNEAWIYGGEEIITAMAKCINKTWNDKIPEEWKAGIVKPVHKKGDKDKIENYRGIALMDTGYKIYVEWIKNKLEEEVKEKKILDRTQFGFRKGKGTIEAIYVIKEIIEQGIRKEKGKIFVCFTDLTAAFDKVKRNEIWKMLREREIDGRLIKKLEEIYKNTIVKINVDNEIVDVFMTTEGVRQGCPLSSELYNIAVSDLEKHMREGQRGGARLGNSRIWTIAYADDTALIAEDEESMRYMINRYVKYIKKKGLIINVDKTKMMCFRKAGGRRKKIEFKIGGKEIETVKKFNYLGYELKENNNEDAHMKYINGKVNSCMGKLWNFGERRFKDDWKLRMKIFDTMIQGIMTYGVEIWGWKEQKVLEKCQEKYIKWVMKLDRETPAYMFMIETGRKKLESLAAGRVLKWDKKMSRKEENSLEKICWEKRKKEYEKNRVEIKKGTKEWERRALMEKVGYSGRIWIKKVEQDMDEMELRKKVDDIHLQEWRASLEKSSYAKEIKEIIGKDSNIHSEVIKYTKDALETFYRFKLGSENRESKYWRSEEEKLCRMCGEEIESIRHILEKCRITGEDRDWKSQLNGDRKCLARIKRINWLRKNKENRENNNG